MWITYILVILGKGILLFLEQPKESKWKLTGNKTYNSDVLMVEYGKRVDLSTYQIKPRQ
jgi:hypothetical protein